MACHVCSTTDVAESVKCEKCTYEKSNGILCERCNKLWHRHKDRVDHDTYPLTKYVIQFLKPDDDHNIDEGYEMISVDERNELGKLFHYVLTIMYQTAIIIVRIYFINLLFTE